VWVAGRALVREGQLIHMDLEDLLNRAARWRDRIQPGLPGTGEAT
jgi:hypothetical protein